MTVFGGVTVDWPVARNRILFGQSRGGVLYPCIGCPTYVSELDQIPTYSRAAAGRGNSAHVGMAWDGDYIYYTTSVHVGVADDRNQVWREPYPSGAHTVLRNPAGTKYSCESCTLDTSGNIWWIENHDASSSTGGPAETVADIMYMPKAGGTVTTVRTITQAAGQATRLGGMVFNPYDSCIYYVTQYRPTPVGTNWNSEIVKMNTSGTTVATHTTSAGALNALNEITFRNYYPLSVDSAGTVWVGTLKNTTAGSYPINTQLFGLKLDGTHIYANCVAPASVGSGAPTPDMWIPWPTGVSLLGSVSPYDAAPFGTTVAGVMIRQNLGGSFDGVDWVDQTGTTWRTPCNPSTMSILEGRFGFLPDHSKVLFQANVSGAEWWAQNPCPVVL